LGSQDVGRRLGDGLIHLGHEVKLGSPNPNKVEVVQWVSDHNSGDIRRRDEERPQQKVSAGNFAEASAFGDLIVVDRIKYEHFEAFIQSIKRRANI
jgi:predicted dinucleotide-binding enzyme